MSEVTMIGIDLAKRVFQLHGACANGTVVFRKKLTRVQLLAFMSRQPACIVAMEACATAHCWGREIEKLGHTVRLIAPYKCSVCGIIYQTSKRRQVCHKPAPNDD